MASEGEQQPRQSFCHTEHTAQIVRLHLRGQDGQEDLKRPFKSGGGIMGGSDPQTDKASIEAAEKANLLYRQPEY